ncbi:rhomboid family intramembrane serine protease [Marinimicrobium sp. ABcell2]|uniref:rhomboid family intramembrane serine protease n=1 Tax=Marinimicrobium sp. ABcell2 TaxID=3069751 RepID=UPI0027B852FA|nr:rhomboid family intramembrane serine protease [Marinimicrobium sp. ABcell2]MDQ2076740.1 rhomboid family intramembrane serine protease [Marinimicrobium sp. ABcell2]
MLIVPIENRPDWSKPPFITLTLILLNVAVFLLFQRQDWPIIERAHSIYENQQLLSYELEPYLDYLLEEDYDAWYELTGIENEARQAEYIRWSIMFDRGFDKHLREIWPDPADERTLRWRQAREQFEQQRNKVSSYRAGLTPGEAKPWTFFTSMFMHGSWDHLLGNMIFLFLFGFTLEAVLRPHTYLLMYLASGLAASALHMAFNMGSMVPVVGASGAISGLMGMYLSLYRLRRIRFFYTVLFYFGEFRAPALFILPLWLGKELYGYFFFESSIAYWAHIGGLLAGAGLMLLARKSHQEFSGELEKQDAHDEVESELKKVLLLLTHLDIDKAKALTRQICQAHPSDPRPWQQLFDLHKAQPKNKAFHQVTFELLKQFVSKDTDFARWRDGVDDVLKEYQSLAPNAPALNGNMSLALARTFWRNGNTPKADDYFQQALQRGGNASGLAALLKEMIPYYQQRQQNNKVAKLALLLKQIQQPS